MAVSALHEVHPHTHNKNPKNLSYGFQEELSNIFVPRSLRAPEVYLSGGLWSSSPPSPYPTLAC